MYGASMAARDFIDNCEAETAVGAATSVFEPGFEHVRQMFGRDPVARVRHCNERMASRRPAAQMDLPALGSMASGVDDEVEEGTGQLLAPTSHHHGFGGIDNPMLSRGAPSSAMHLEQKLAHVNGFGRHLVHLDPAQEQHVVDVFSHAFQFLESDVDCLLHVV